MLRSVMKTSDSPAPEASRLETDGLNSRPRTAPWCRSMLATSGSAPSPLPTRHGGSALGRDWC